MAKTTPRVVEECWLGPFLTSTAEITTEIVDLKQKK